MDLLLQHFRHEHPLEFVQDHEEGDVCDCCGKRVEGPSYCCSQCKFYVHKKCAKLELAPEINHPFHSKHPLTLVYVKSPNRSYMCDFCRRIDVSQFAYRCDSCDFDLDVNCALLQISSAENFPNSLHDHPMFLITNHNNEIEGDCGGCKRPLSGPIYNCLDCDEFYLHKRCAELELAPQMYHPLHPKHPLSFLPKPHWSEYQCYFCGRRQFSGFVYHCASCKINMHVNCALLHFSCAENFPNRLHDHPVIFIENHNDEIDYDCRGCKQPLSGPIYKCLDCLEFYLHKKCGELPVQINHPYDRAHPLYLNWRNPTAREEEEEEECYCSLCKIKWDGFVYCCSFCDVELTPEDVSAPSTIIAAGDDKPWTLVSCRISFICDFCGDDGDRTPYISTTGDLILHKDCISMPKAIRIARHPHPISHVYSVQQDQVEELDCRICHENVDARYGCYCCCASDCNYIAHMNCATDTDIWDGTVLLEDDIEMWKELGNESMNMITDVISEVRVGEDVMATEIKHAFHHHNLILTFAGEIEEGSTCDGCMLPISTPFYSCQQCKFYLHKICAELPREKGHPTHKHLLKLTQSGMLPCFACHRERDGFSYRCEQRECGGFKIDVQCSLMPDTLRHPSHEHSLFLSHNYEGLHREQKTLAYRRTKRCDFAIDMSVLVLPPTTWYKYDKHPLTLTYNDDSDPSQRYCDFCEEERDSKPWFYYCAHCDNSLHKECALGPLPFIKLGGACNFSFLHPHTLTFVDNIWNCPRCYICRKLCYRQTLECKESGCNFTIHWHCV